LPRSADDKGQVLSSFAAVAAVVAIVAGLLVLFGTRGDNSAAGSKPNSTPAAKTSFSHPTSAPATTPGQPSTTPSQPTPSQPRPSQPTPSQPTPSAQPTVGSTPIPTAELPEVVVFNNTKRKGLADQVATKARAVGWRVAGADNWHGKVVTSTVYYPAGLQAEAAQLAKVLGIGRIKDALPNMQQDRLSVILTTDYAG
jgi:LytR cell envelope-related transcriptional attenuator